MENNVLIQPVVSEKSYALANADNKYTFVVDKDATKIDVKKAVEMKYKVKVLGVNVITRAGKLKRDWARYRRFRRSDVRKAIVKLKKGDKIEEFLNI